MKLYIKQHIFTWGDKFSIYDEAGCERFFVEGEVFTFGKKLHLTDTRGVELSYIHQELSLFRPRYLIRRGSRDIAEVTREFTFFKPEYTVDGLGWRVEGDFFSHEYTVSRGDTAIASVSKEWFTLGDAYAIDIAPGVDAIDVLSVVLVIDAVLASQDN